jgi:N-acetyl-anhydromuramyl-L-alanine amidase AmpD
VQGIIFHHTGGRGSAQGVINTLNSRGLGVQYIIDRSGKIWRGLPDGARGAQILPANNGSGLSNANTVGVEVIAGGNDDVLPAQIAAGKQLANALMAKYGLTPQNVWGHGQVNVGHKQADEGMAIVDAVQGVAS